MSWPDVNPVWQFCWLRPADSSGTNGSGIEIRDVHYNGHLVLKRGHVPIVNVQYETGNLRRREPLLPGLDESVEWDMLADNICPPPYSGVTCGYAEPTCPPVDRLPAAQGVDVCAVPPPDCVRSCFRGCYRGEIRRPPRPDHRDQGGVVPLRDQVDVFLEDGRFQPTFGFSAVADGCVALHAPHHAY